MQNDDLDAIFAQYLPKLLSLAERRIHSQYRSKFDADDIANTVLRTVFRRIKAGSFTFDDDESLWKQLATVAVRRISNKIRDLNTLKAGGGRQLAASEVNDSFSRSPDPADAAALIEVVQLLGEQLKDDERQILELRMAGFTKGEIAEQMSISPRTVTRKLELVKLALSRVI